MAPGLHQPFDHLQPVIAVQPAAVAFADALKHLGSQLPQELFVHNAFEVQLVRQPSGLFQLW
jgi:hypothetical protein